LCRDRHELAVDVDLGQRQRSPRLCLARVWPSWNP
jgi:hypothetical protein